MGTPSGDRRWATTHTSDPGWAITTRRGSAMLPATVACMSTSTGRSMARPAPAAITTPSVPKAWWAAAKTSRSAGTPPVIAAASPSRSPAPAIDATVTWASSPSAVIVTPSTLTAWPATSPRTPRIESSPPIGSPAARGRRKSVMSTSRSTYRHTSSRGSGISSFSKAARPWSERSCHHGGNDAITRSWVSAVSGCKVGTPRADAPRLYPPRSPTPRPIRPSNRCLASTNTPSNIASVRRPVNVFCWLGWYDPNKIEPTTSTTAP